MASQVFKWRINQFSEVASREANDSIEKYFSVRRIDNDLWIQFEPISDYDSDFCSFHLFMSDPCASGFVNVQFKLWLENKHGKKIPERPKVMTHKFELEDSIAGEADFVLADQLYLPGNNFVKGDLILLCCEIMHINSGDKASFDSNFREELLSLYEQGFTGDCILKVNDQELKVSKQILMANSDVLERMLTTDTIEAKNNIIEIKEVRFEVMEKFVKYLHSPTSFYGISIEHVEELFLLADYYNVEALISDCVFRLAAFLSDENIVRYLRLAFKHNNVDLKEYALFYARDIFPDILKSQNWDEFVNQEKDLAWKINSAIVEKICSVSAVEID